MKKLKGIDGKLDDAWAKLVKLKAGMKCEKCSKTTALNSHHIYSRSKKSTRWDTDNGSCLCVGCHVFSFGFSAHKTPTEFTMWILKKRGDKWFDALTLKANTPQKLFKFEKEELLELLTLQIDCFD